MSGAATTRFLVNKAAAVVPGQASTKARSGRPLALIPAQAAAKAKPAGRHIFFLETRRELSYLDLHQPIGRLRKYRELGQFAAYHGDLIAAMKPGTDTAVFVDFVGQVFALGHGESQASKELRNTGKQADGTDIMLFSLRQQGFDQPLAASRTLTCGIDGDGANLRQMRAIKMKRATADNVRRDLRARRSRERFRKLRRRCAAAEFRHPEYAAIRFMDLLGVGKKGFTRAHGRPPAWFPLFSWRRQWPAELAPAPCRPEHRE